MLIEIGDLDGLEHLACEFGDVLAKGLRGQRVSARDVADPLEADNPLAGYLLDDQRRVGRDDGVGVVLLQQRLQRLHQQCDSIRMEMDLGLIEQN